MNSTFEKLNAEVEAEFGFSLKDKFIDEVDNATDIMRFMTDTAMNWHDKDIDPWEIGKKLQFASGNPYNIPFRTEMEVSAGVWALIYKNGKLVT